MFRTTREISRRGAGAPALPARPEPFRVSLVFGNSAVSRPLADAIRGLELDVDCYLTGREFLMDPRVVTAGAVLVNVSLADMKIDDFVEQTHRLATIPKIIVCPNNARIPDAIRTLNNGAFELLLRVSDTSAVIAAVTRAYRSWYELDADDLDDLADQFDSGYERLAAREREIFDLVAQGHSSQDIATLLEVSLKTVEAHRSRINSKMRMENLGHLMRMWRAGME